jgi:iron(III) transport system substrate-binding protein
LSICLERAAFGAAPEDLIQAAKKEGEVVLYASMNIGEANTTIAKFEEKYPFVKVKMTRTGSEKLLTKALTEARAGQPFADVIQTVEFSMHTFTRNRVLARHTPSDDRFYPKDFKEEGYWTTVYYNPYVAAYNTRLVPRANLPKTYENLLHPQWKGAIMMEGTKVDWFAGMLQIMGKEKGLRYMRELAKQGPVLRVGHELLAQLVAAGEGSFDINIPASSVDRMKERGAPIDWTALGPAPAIMVGVGIANRAPHPNAAKLFMDFVLSREGQRVMLGFGRMVARSDLAGEQNTAARGVKMVPVSPSLADNIDGYAKLMREIFSK